MRVAVALTITCALAGCGTKLVDPCKGKPGTCLSVQIDPSPTVTRISGATVHITADGVDQTSTVATEKGGTADLPVALAVLFVNVDMTMNARVDVVGLLAGSTVGEGVADVAVVPGSHSSARVMLQPVGAADVDMAGTDVDMVSSDLTGYVPLTVTMAGTGKGSINATGLTCDATSCMGLYPPHSTVVIAASSASNATFGGWSGGGCVGNGSTCTVTLDQPTTVAATFDWKFVPSHVPATAYDTGAANLINVTSIDTHNLTINGAAPPAAVKFQFNQGNAVLSIGNWTVDSAVTVTGDAGLIVVAAGAVNISATGRIDVSAKGRTAGPGGSLACSNRGTGGEGPIDNTSGGGGNYAGSASAGGGPAGMPYGPTFAEFCGGASGGAGGRFNCNAAACLATGHGGGGGGALQISSAVSITVMGKLWAAGGGGEVGYYDGSGPLIVARDAGGGGSGGTVVLEAPQVMFSNCEIVTNGGGGAGPRAGAQLGTAGGDGAPTLGLGGDGGDATANPREVGGGGAFRDGSMTLRPASLPNPLDRGGGGGGFGRIWLRTRGTAPDLTTAVLTPDPTVDTTL